MKRYHQISLKEREKIYLAYQNGQSMRQISIQLGRNVSTISREIKRNSCQTIGCSADRADKFAKDRANKNILKIEKHPKLSRKTSSLQGEDGKASLGSFGFGCISLALR